MSNSEGKVTIGFIRGRNPLVVETMKAGRDTSSGRVSSRTLKGAVPIDPMFGL